MKNVLKSGPSDMQLRSQLEEMVLDDLLGPVGGEHEELFERNVRDRYLVAVLAPSRQSGAAAAATEEDEEKEIPALVDLLSGNEKGNEKNQKGSG